MWKRRIKKFLTGSWSTESQKNIQGTESERKTSGEERREEFRFQKAEISENCHQVRNPGCGWYHLYTFDAAEIGQPLYIACEEEELVLLRFGIGAFQNEPISEKSMKWMRVVLRFFQENQKGMILRFAYDLEGKGLEHEPGRLGIVQEHMHQIGSLIREFANDIYAVQGILIGNWGEMHGSRYLLGDGMTELAGVMLQELKGNCPLAVRKPEQWRELTKKGLEEQDLTLFNDGIFGSGTDLGTYGTTQGSCLESRKEELTWQHTAMRGRFCCGEVLPDVETGIGISAAEAEHDLESMHISGLNSTYDLRILEQWKQEKTGGESGYDRIGKRLGYRFLVKDVKVQVEKKQMVLEIIIVNQGFAELTEEAECLLEWQEGEKKGQFLLPVDPRWWNSGEETVIHQRIGMPDIDGVLQIFLKLRRKRDGRPLLFAQEGAETGRIFLGTLMSV